MKIVLFLSFFFLASWAFGQTPCADSRFFQDNVKVNAQTSAVGGCYLSITPFQIKNLTYRDFLFDDKGMIMVFSSYGPGPISSTTGAREFYLFPRQNKIPTYEVLENDAVIVTHPSGTLFRFPFSSGDLSEITPGKVTVSSFFDPAARSGVEFIQFKGILLDTGFQMGNTPSADPNRQSTFTDEDGNTCKVKNKELFDYLRNGDVQFKFLSDPPLAKLLSQKCPKLKATLLTSE